MGIVPLHGSQRSQDADGGRVLSNNPSNQATLRMPAAHQRHPELSDPVNPQAWVAIWKDGKESQWAGEQAQPHPQKAPVPSINVRSTQGESDVYLSI